jgi:type IV pilus assembly protein PilO
MKLPEINFNDLDIKSVGEWPLILRIGILAAIALITLIAAYFFVIKSELATLTTQDKLNETKRKEFQDKYNLAANLDAYQKQMQVIKNSYKASLNELPASDELPELIESIAIQAEANGLIVQTIKPGEPKAVLGFYKELPIKLTLQGTYNQFGSFISDIAKIPRIITIHDFSIKRGGNKNDPTSNILTLDLDAKTYWLSSEKDLPPVDTKKKGSKSTGRNPPANSNTPPMPQGSVANPTGGVE